MDFLLSTLFFLSRKHQVTYQAREKNSAKPLVTFMPGLFVNFQKNIQHIVFHVLKSDIYTQDAQYPRNDAISPEYPTIRILDVSLSASCVLFLRVVVMSGSEGA